MKITRVLLLILQDILLAGLFLCVFALFHHVIPYRQAAKMPAEPVMTVERPADTAENGEQESTDNIILTPWQERFAEHFSDELTVTENTYKSPSVSVTVERVTTELDGIPQQWYVADIYIAQIENFAAHAAEGSFNYLLKAPMEQLAQESDAILAVNGDYCSAQVNFGIYARNGVLYSDNPSGCDICVLYYDGSMETYPAWSYDLDEILERAPYQIWKFGPMLLDGSGKRLGEYNISDEISSYNPRCGIGYFEPGHYCFVVAEGRLGTRARGLTIDRFAGIFENLGCTAAYNLDGGASAVMYFGGECVSQQSAERNIGDILLIRELPEA